MNEVVMVKRLSSLTFNSEYSLRTPDTIRKGTSAQAFTATFDSPNIAVDACVLWVAVEGGTHDRNKWSVLLNARTSPLASSFPRGLHTSLAVMVTLDTAASRCLV